MKPYSKRKNQAIFLFLRVLEEKIDRRPIEKELNEFYPSKRGRPSYPPLMMLKALLLENWYNLSDPALEEAIRDRTSFQWLLGLSFMESLPDETTICRFRTSTCFQLEEEQRA